MKVYENILELVGRTPIVHLNKIEKSENTAARLFAKLEFFNPSGSVKARTALNMIEQAEKNGDLVPGSVIIEGTSGNTGIGIAMVSAVKDYKTIICMPENMSKERIALLKAYGADVHLTPKEKNMGGAGEKARELSETLPKSLILGQGANPNNPSAHYKTTGPEIWEDLDGKVDIFVTCVGTGGTVTGTGKYLREQNPDIQIIGVEPAGCPVLSGGEAGPHKIQGIGGGMICPVTDMSLFNEIITVTDEDAYEYSRLSAKEEGILIGISAGAALKAATDVAKRPENQDKNIVLIFPDGGDHYLSGDLFEDQSEKGVV
ncbi:MAG: cysteine synthase A [Oscillospiraceae bacterium]|nr:cysteine synthase A [Oscillospiraceae bacterium]